MKACADLGIFSDTLTPPDSVSTEELVAIVKGLNARPDIDAILVQLPLPKQVDTRRVLESVDTDKDVDGFHPFNVGRLVENAPGPRPCTPGGIIQILRRYKIEMSGKHAVVVGRSDIVGKPMAMLLLHEHATVAICHSRTTGLAEECSRADILVVAIGRAAMIRAEFIKPGATVIDVGINRITDRREAARLFASAPQRLADFEKKGSAVVGDVHPVEVAERAGAYTPVPGGVGPLTIAMLMLNTIECAERRCSP